LKSLILLKHSSKVVWVYFTHGKAKIPEVQLFSQKEKKKEKGRGLSEQKQAIRKR